MDNNNQGYGDVGTDCSIFSLPSISAAWRTKRPSFLRGASGGRRQPSPAAKRKLAFQQLQQPSIVWQPAVTFSLATPLAARTSLTPPASWCRAPGSGIMSSICCMVRHGAARWKGEGAFCRERERGSALLTASRYIVGMLRCCARMKIEDR